MDAEEATLVLEISAEEAILAEVTLEEAISALDSLEVRWEELALAEQER